MARALVRRSVRKVGTRRETRWVVSVDIVAVTALPGAAIVFDQFFSTGALQAIGALPCTIVRTRGLLVVNSDQVTGAERAFGAMGMAIVSDQA